MENVLKELAFFFLWATPLSFILLIPVGKIIVFLDNWKYSIYGLIYLLEVIVTPILIFIASVGTLFDLVYFFPKEYFWNFINDLRHYYNSFGFSIQVGYIISGVILVILFLIKLLFLGCDDEESSEMIPAFPFPTGVGLYFYMLTLSDHEYYVTLNGDYSFFLKSAIIIGSFLISIDIFALAIYMFYRTSIQNKIKSIFLYILFVVLLGVAILTSLAFITEAIIAIAGGAILLAGAAGLMDGLSSPTSIIAHSNKESYLFGDGKIRTYNKSGSEYINNGNVFEKRGNYFRRKK